MEPNYESMDLPELYTAMVAMDELIAQMAKFNINDPRHHARRAKIAALIESRFPDVPVEAFAIAEDSQPQRRPFGMVNPTPLPSVVQRYARVAYGSVLDYREIADEDLPLARRNSALEGIELLPVDDQREFDDNSATKYVDRVKIKNGRAVLTRRPV